MKFVQIYRPFISFFSTWFSAVPTEIRRHTGSKRGYGKSAKWSKHFGTLYFGIRQGWITDDEDLRIALNMERRGKEDPLMKRHMEYLSVFVRILLGVNYKKRTMTKDETRLSMIFRAYQFGIAARMMLLLNYWQIAEILARRALKFARPQQVTEIQVKCYDILKHGARQRGNGKKFRKFYELRRKYEGILRAERRAGDFIDLHHLESKGSCELGKHIEIVTIYARKYNTLILHQRLYYLRELYGFFTEDADSIIAATRDLENFHKQKPKLVSDYAAARVALTRARLFFHTGRQKDGLSEAIQSLKSVARYQGTNNWYATLMFAFLNAMHIGSYRQTLLYYKQVWEWLDPKTDPARSEEWRIYGAYLRFALETHAPQMVEQWEQIDTGLTEKQQQRPWWDIQLKALKEDKNGWQIALSVLQLAVYARQAREHSDDVRATAAAYDRIASFTARITELERVRPKPLPRTRLFNEILTAVADSGFDMPAFAPELQTKMAQLMRRPDQGGDTIETYEFLPYDAMADIILTALPRVAWPIAA